MNEGGRWYEAVKAKSGWGWHSPHKTKISLNNFYTLMILPDKIIVLSLIHTLWTQLVF